MQGALRTAVRARGESWPASARGSARDAETELVALAHTPAPLRRALARVAGRLVATRAWERLGFARLADYAAERAGVSARELRDLAAVDRALRLLPAVEAAFVRGEIGWTQARLVCRVATPEDEPSWLAAAKRLPAAALAREVRAVDRCAREAGRGVSGVEAERVGVVLRCTPAVRARWWRARQLAQRVAGHALTGEALAEAIAAEVCSAVTLEEEVSDAEPMPALRAETDAGVGASLPARPPATSAMPVSTLCADLERDLDTADAFELDARLRRALRIEAQRLAHVAALLDEVVAQRTYVRLGYSGLDRYAEERLGMAPSRARALLRVARAARHCPALRDAFAHGRLSWVQAHRLVPLLLEPASRLHRAQWVAHAQRVSVRRLSDDVEVALAAGQFALRTIATATAALQTGAISRSRAETARVFFAAAPEIAQLFRAVLATVQRRLERIRGAPATQSEALDAMLEHVLDAWGAQQSASAIRREHRVFARDGWRCTVPGCSSYRDLHGHHIVYRSHQGSDELGNLTTICAWHHQQGVHRGRVSCHGEAPHALRFELGRRPPLSPLVSYGPGEVLV